MTTSPDVDLVPDEILTTQPVAAALERNTF